jgi:hypothetical protein
MKLIAQLLLTSMFILTGVSAYNSVKKASNLDYDYKFSTSLLFESIDAPQTNKVVEKIHSVAPKTVTGTSFIKLLLPKKAKPKQPVTPKFDSVIEEALTPEKIVIRPDTMRTRRKFKLMVRRLSDSEVVNRNL